ncbi:MAG: hypothetical protein AB2L14_33785 [Candidatus Xenobiia bacterium LiM19]
MKIKGIVDEYEAVKIILVHLDEVVNSHFDRAGIMVYNKRDSPQTAFFSIVPSNFRPSTGPGGLPAFHRVAETFLEVRYEKVFSFAGYCNNWTFGSHRLRRRRQRCGLTLVHFGEPSGL